MQYCSICGTPDVNDVIVLPRIETGGAPICDDCYLYIAVPRPETYEYVVAG